MGSEVNADKLSIKNILFTKALPNYTIPVPTNGYKTFPCTDCGDRFLFESSYNDHINRKSLKITYFCRHCNEIIINNNRCRLLSHIRSHGFKTTTINVSDLKLQPLPIQDINWNLSQHNNSQVETQPQGQDITCYECKANLDGSNKIYKDRAKHYTKYTNTVYSCPVCLFALPNLCALKAHLRIHLKVPPFFCPECGIHLSIRSISYPYNHDCEGFNMIRATTRLQCKQKKCNKILHPNDYKMHIENHIKKVYKCIKCSKVWNSKPNEKHLPCSTNNNILSFFQCAICENKLLQKRSIHNHLNLHLNTLQMKMDDHIIYPCLSCNLICNDISTLINHHIDKHAINDMKNILVRILMEYKSLIKPVKQGFCRVLKKCDKCSRSFLYRCKYENIKILPNECSYGCSRANNNGSHSNENLIVCSLCKYKVIENWDKIKNHFATFHKNHKCLDLKVNLMKIDNKTSGLCNNADNLKYVKSKNRNLKKNKRFLRKEKISKRKGKIELNTINDNSAPTEEYICKICNNSYENKQSFEIHITTHRDPCMSYQCLECGKCFVVKPSFSTHLLMEHGIADVEKYINEKECYNKAALLKQPNNDETIDEPIKENQCKICRDQFDNSIDLEKHFRMHGMAFLMKNTNKSNSP